MVKFQTVIHTTNGFYYGEPWDPESDKFDPEQMAQDLSEILNQGTKNLTLKTQEGTFVGFNAQHVIAVQVFEIKED